MHNTIQYIPHLEVVSFMVVTKVLLNQDGGLCTLNSTSSLQVIEYFKGYQTKESRLPLNIERAGGELDISR